MDVTIPSLGESVTEATIGRWLKSDGDVVSVDEAILELESDKANMDLAAEAAGVLRILKPAGETVTAGDVVARIEPATAATQMASAAPGEAKKTAPAARSNGGTAAGAAERSMDDTAATREPPLTPAVRRIAEETQLDLSGVQGSGPGGRITKGDALQLAAKAAGGQAPGARPTPAAEVPAAAVPEPVASAQSKAGTAPHAGRELDEGRVEKRVPMSRIRRVIARRLVEAQHTAAILTTFNEVDMSAVLELRSRYKDSFQKRHGVSLGFMSFFVKACCEAAAQVPELNAEIQGDLIVYRRFVHMGVAVGTEEGLVVPVIRDADRLSFAEIEQEIGRLAGLARDAKLSVADLSDATFTISNGGVYGSLLSTPILNPPQSGILGMHKIEKRPVVVDDQIQIRPMMYLALSYDHRIVDGKGAVTFLVRVKEAIEDPARLLLGI